MKNKNRKHFFILQTLSHTSNIIGGPYSAGGWGGLHPGGREVTACRRGFTVGVPAVGGGLPTRNGVTGKMRLKQR